MLRTPSLGPIADIARPFRGLRLMAVTGAVAVAAGATWWVGGAGAILVFAIGFVLVAAAAGALASPEDRTGAVVVVSGVYLARTFVTALLHAYLQESSGGGALFQDDLGYVTWAAAIARIWHGEPSPFPADPSIVNTYVRGAGWLFWVMGPNVLALKITNTVLAILAAVFTYRTTLIVAGSGAARIAGAAMLVWPSIVLWSALTLKEAFSLFSSMGVTWTVAELVRTRRWPWIIATVALALPLQDTRGYLFTLLVLGWPLVLTALWLLRRNMPLRITAASWLAAALLIANIRPGFGVTPDTLVQLEHTRSAMAESANSALVEATRTMQAADGQCFVVSVIGRSDATGGRIIVAPAGSTFISSDRRTTDIAPPRNAVAVDHGDVVCIGRAPEGAAAQAPPPTMFVAPAGSTKVVDGAASNELAPSAEEQLVRSIGYLPQGALYLLAAPFPWDLSGQRALLLPEMLIWYAAVGLAALGAVVLWRRRAWEALYVALIGLALAAVLSLAEGNLGTLVRHRGMMVPYVAVVAGVGAATLWARIAPRGARRVAG